MNDELKFSDSRVKFLYDNRKRLETLRLELSFKYGFSFKRTRNYKNCVVIRWKSSRTKCRVNCKRIDEYIKICKEISDTFSLWEEQDPFLESELRLAKIGIYVLYEYSYITWAIPNEKKDIQDFVLSKVPKWAKVTYKF